MGFATSTTDLSNVAQQLFAAEVHQAFQQSPSKLRGFVTLRTGVNGDSYKFRTMQSVSSAVYGGGFNATEANSFVDLSGKAAANALVSCDLASYESHLFTDLFSQSDVNFDERRETAKAIASALNRRVDSLICTELATAPLGAGSAGSPTSMTLALLLEGQQLLNAKNVPPGDRHLVIHAKGLSDLLTLDQVSSVDYSNVRALVNGEVNTFLGCTVTVMGDSEDATNVPFLPKTSSNRSAYMFHKSAIGMAIGKDATVGVDWIPEKLAWLAVGTLRAGAKTIDADGVVEIEYAA